MSLIIPAQLYDYFHQNWKCNDAKCKESAAIRTFLEYNNIYVHIYDRNNEFEIDFIKSLENWYILATGRPIIASYYYSRHLSYVYKKYQETLQQCIELFLYAFEICQYRCIKDLWIYLKQPLYYVILDLNWGHILGGNIVSHYVEF
jgi:hypothetical protein